MSDTPTSPGAPGPGPISERRASIRLPPRNVEIIWQLLGQTSDEPLAAQVLNVSNGGIGMLLERPVKLGSVLCLRLRPADPHCPTLLVRVRHITLIAADEYQVGGTFVMPLSDEALQAVTRARYS